MANKRRKVDKYSRIKPKVSPLTFIGIGVFFLVIILTVFLVTDSPSTKLAKAYQNGARQNGFEIDLTKDHNFKTVKLSKLENLIDSNDEIIIYFGNPNCINCVRFIDQAQKAYDNADPYNNKVNEYISTIYYVELDQLEEGFSLEGLDKFYEEHELKGANSIPAMIAFKKGEVVAQYEVEELEGLTEEQIIFRSVNNFFNKASEGFVANN